MLPFECMSGTQTGDSLLDRVAPLPILLAASHTRQGSAWAAMRAVARQKRLRRALGWHWHWKKLGTGWVGAAVSPCPPLASAARSSSRREPAAELESSNGHTCRRTPTDLAAQERVVSQSAVPGISGVVSMTHPAPIRTRYGRTGQEFERAEGRNRRGLPRRSQGPSLDLREPREQWSTDVKGRIGGGVSRLTKLATAMRPPVTFLCPNSFPASVLAPLRRIDISPFGEMLNTFLNALTRDDHSLKGSA
ncbi:hypothetical protein NA57DRAFT_60163 [Rhizodiscina lignyota]|uniref:Uncharacterized protein n=1 Tax=Rhizodiscina lignyota TaxID=1504668 RepID=A0A9P4I4C6_9PEZI|nr:hypothetical protein NA57DRAFT_60163 [Rhizodiscina lignyota]